MVAICAIYVAALRHGSRIGKCVVAPRQGGMVCQVHGCTVKSVKFIQMHGGTKSR